VLARIIEPTSKLDVVRVLEETFVPDAQASPYANPLWRKQISTACAAHAALGPASHSLGRASKPAAPTDDGVGGQLFTASQ